MLASFGRGYILVVETAPKRLSYEKTMQIHYVDSFAVALFGFFEDNFFHDGWRRLRYDDTPGHAAVAVLFLRFFLKLKVGLPRLIRKRKITMNEVE